MKLEPRKITTRKVNWVGASFIIITPILAVPMTIYHLMTEGFVWQVWLLAAIMYALTASSITGGYHRHFAHRAYQCRTWLKWFWALFGAAAFQNSILIWARDHRAHHRYVDTDYDPYSINRGFWFAHFGWMLYNEDPPIPVEPFERDLKMDPIVAFQDKHYVLIASFMCFVLPLGIGALMGHAFGGLAIAGVLRVVTLHHATFFINSACHYFGRQTYTDSNSAKDSLIMAFATFGEGYHNFHHYFANDYRNGVRWYHWDPTKWVIRLFAMIGGAYNLRRTPASEIFKAEMEMQERVLKSKLSNQWQQQFQAKLDNLKVQVHAAHVRIEKLREEYKKIASDYANASMERLEELRSQLRLARQEFREALRQWREYNSYLMNAVPA